MTNPASGNEPVYLALTAHMQEQQDQMTTLCGLLDAIDYLTEAQKNENSILCIMKVAMKIANEVNGALDVQVLKRIEGGAA